MAVASTFNLPPTYLEPLGEGIADLLAKILPLQEGQTLDLSGVMPQVAGVSPLIQQAQQRAATQAGLGTLQFSPDTGAVTGIGQGTGIASYEPFIQQAQQLLAPSAYQQYMSPYQQEVIDATTRLLEEQRAKGRQQLSAQAIEQGAFGGGREGVARAEYERGRDISDAGLLAQLRQAGLQSAQTLQQQGIANLLNIPQIQQGLQASTTAGLGAAGAGAQTYSQALLDALQQGNLFAMNYPVQQLQQASNIFSGLAGAIPSTPSAPQVTSPALAAAQAFGSVYGGLAPRQQANLAPVPQQQQQNIAPQYGLASLY
jgi:protein-disulfide isomerase-like protein with CxxC motif